MVVKLVFLFDKIDVETKFKHKKLSEGLEIPELPATVVVVEEENKIVYLEQVNLEEQAKNYYSYCKKRRNAIAKREKK